MRVAVVALIVLVSLSACSGTSNGDPDAPKEKDAAANTCAEVRAGISDFNRNKYDSTIEHFKKAVPLALEYARGSEAKKADDLLEAVKYYADLPADQYRDAFQNSPKFKKYQRITLGQCESGAAPADDEGTPT